MDCNSIYYICHNSLIGWISFMIYWNSLFNRKLIFLNLIIMKKLLSYFFHNEEITHEKQAEVILRYILAENDTTDSIKIFNALEILFRAEMINREKEASHICRLVNSKYPTTKVSDMIVNDPIFEKPIKL